MSKECLSVSIEEDRSGVNCAVAGIYAPGEDVSRLTLNLLKEMQHRGQESSGIVVSNRERLRGSWGLGLVSQVFGDRRTWEGSSFETREEYFDRDHLPSLHNACIAIGHNRYSNTGSSNIQNAGPFLADGIALSHNGNLTNAKELRDYIVNRDVTPRGSTDSEIMSHFIAVQKGNTWEEKIITGLRQFSGSYSLAMMTKESLYAAKDPMGNRPLVLGRITKDGQIRAWVVASETSAIEKINGEIIREIEPGECIRIDQNGLTTIDRQEPMLAYCPFEPVYLMRPDSLWNRIKVANIRFQAGQWLHGLHPVVEAQAVTAIPYSAMLAAQGYAYEAKIPFVEVIYKDRWQGRIFMDPDQKAREVRTLKYSIIPEVIKQLNINELVIIDDSIVRGTTTEPLIRLLKEAAPELKIHLRIVWPQIYFPCFYGVDFSSFSEIFRHNFPQLNQALEYLHADSLAHLTPHDLSQIIQRPVDELCFACHTGIYPTEIPKNQHKFYLEKPA